MNARIRQGGLGRWVAYVAKDGHPRSAFRSRAQPCRLQTLVRTPITPQGGTSLLAALTLLLRARPAFERRDKSQAPYLRERQHPREKTWWN